MIKPNKDKKLTKLRSYQNGQAVLGSVIFLVLLSVVIITGFATPLTRELKNIRVATASRQSYFAAESGIEDAAHRLKNKLAYSSPHTLDVGAASAVTTVTELLNNRQIDARGDADNHQRFVSSEFNLSDTGVEFFYGLHIGDGGLSMANGAIVNGNVYSNGDIIGSGIGAGGPQITGDAVVAGGINSAPSAEQTAQENDYFFATTGDNRDLAQSFIAGADEKLNRVSVYLAKVGNPSNLVLRLSEDNNNKPKDSSLATVTILTANVGTTPSWIDLAFSNPPSLSNGAKYWIVLDSSSYSATDHWNWRMTQNLDYIFGVGKFTNNWSAGGAVWTEMGGTLAARVWWGGVNTKIKDVTIGDSDNSEAWANVFVNAKVHGANCPNDYCHIDNPARAELPISDGLIQDWRDDALAGGVCAEPLCDASGNLHLDNSESLTVGPLKIPGNLTMDNGSALTLTGTIWVAGTMSLSCGNLGLVSLVPSYGEDSGVLLGDDSVNISNNCQLAGSGDPASYIMLLSAKDATADEVMTIDNNSAGVIYYAAHGRIKFSNNATAKEATAYGITMDNGATVTYETGLASINFSAGPGGAFQVVSWREVE